MYGKNDWPGQRNAWIAFWSPSETGCVTLGRPLVNRSRRRQRERLGQEHRHLGARDRALRTVHQRIQ
jgi:hypothetical protein